MIIYAVTINIDSDIEEEWLNWMKKTHAPEVLATKCFIESKIYKVLEGEEDCSYIIQYLCKDMQIFQNYQQNFSRVLQEKHTKKYEGKFIASRTLLKIIDRSLLDEN